ncbi:hypothetical protein Tco_1060981 [Tanacetum coccineum]
MSNTNSLIKGHWSNTKPGLGLSNIWYQSKTGRHLRRRQHLNFIQRELRRENEARLVSQQGYNTILEESTRKVEDKDRDCLMSHQWDFGKTCEPTARTAVQKGKEKLEHLGVKLEDTEEGEDSQEQPTLSHSTRTQNLQGMIIGPSTSRITSNGESGSNTSDDFIIIT